MELIKTTRTQVEKMAAEAKSLRTQTQRRLTACQDEVARRHGYHHWQHVRLSLNASHQDTGAAPPVVAPREGFNSQLDAYLHSLSTAPAADVLVNEPKGSVFYDVTIEGVRFQGKVGSDPSLSRLGSHQDVPFGVGIICSARSARGSGAATGTSLRGCVSSLRQSESRKWMWRFSTSTVNGLKPRRMSSGPCSSIDHAHAAL